MSDHVSISVQGYVGAPPDGIVWQEPVLYPSTRAAFEKHLRSLRSRRARYHPVLIPNGIEIYTYRPGYFPPGCPELDGSRTRIVFVPAEDGPDE